MAELGRGLPYGGAGYSTPVHMVGIVHLCTCWVYTLGMHLPTHPGYAPPYTPWVYHLPSMVYYRTRHSEQCVRCSSEEALGSRKGITLGGGGLEPLRTSKVLELVGVCAQSYSASLRIKHERLDRTRVS